MGRTSSLSELPKNGKEGEPSSRREHFARNVAVKALALFVLFNLVFGLLNPAQALGRFSLYNLVFPGRARLPYGDHPDKAYNLSLNNLDAMFASHEISAGEKPEDEFRVVLIGDSATWGFLLQPGDTLSAELNEAMRSTPEGKKIRFFNLGYPVMSLSKDLLLLSYALRYQPDLIVWLVTLESFPKDKQFFPPLLQNNLAAVETLFDRLGLNADWRSLPIQKPNFWEKTVIGSRRALADLVRLQLYGMMWAATGVDQEIPEAIQPPERDFNLDQSFHNLQPPELKETDLAFEVLEAGIRLAKPTPVLIINEPMFISDGTNSDIRYNFYYPRWAYDSYRQLLANLSARRGWILKDFWNEIPPEEFTNSAVHLSPAGTQQLSKLVMDAVMEELDSLGN